MSEYSSRQPIVYNIPLGKSNEKQPSSTNIMLDRKKQVAQAIHEKQDEFVGSELDRWSAVNVKQYGIDVSHACALIDIMSEESLEGKIISLEKKIERNPDDLLGGQALIEGKVAQHLAAYGEGSVSGGITDDESISEVYTLTTPDKGVQYLPVQYAPESSAQGLYNELTIQVVRTLARTDRMHNNGFSDITLKSKYEEVQLLDNMVEIMRHDMMQDTDDNIEREGSRYISGIRKDLSIEDALARVEARQHGIERDNMDTDWAENSIAAREDVKDLIKNYMRKSGQKKN